MAPRAQAKVMVVDDDPDLRRATARVLDRAGYQVATAADGARALEQVATESPDLVLLDVIMKGMDGFEVCQRIKKRHTPAPLVVLASNGRAQPRDRIRGLSVGADGYLARPISNEELLAQVQAYARLRTDHQSAAQKLEQERVARRTLEAKLDSVVAQLDDTQAKLEERAIALRVLAEQLRDDRSQLEEYFTSNLRIRIKPLLESMLGADRRIDEWHLDLLDELIQHATDPIGRRLEAPGLDLSVREREICSLILAGQSSKEIAGLLHLSEHTIHTHRRRIRKKLRISPKTSLEQGLRAL